MDPHRLGASGTMEHEEDSLGVDSLFCTPTDFDWGLSSSPTSQQPNYEQQRCADVVAQSSAQAGKKTLEQALELPDFIPTEVELVQDYLRLAIQRMQPEDPTLAHHGYSGRQYSTSRELVNAKLPTMDPWELPGMIARNNKGGMRDKYYLTDHRGLVFYDIIFRELQTPNGVWKRQAYDTAIRAGQNELVGIKTTMEFHPYTGDDALPLSGTKANWIMHIYFGYFGTSKFLRNDLVLCHVFKADSPDYNDTPKCPPGACNGNHSGQASGAPSNASFNSTYPGSRPMHHHDAERLSDPMLNSYIAEYDNVLLGDPDPDNPADTEKSSARRGDPPTADHGHSKKRKKSSDVWGYFTKMFARDINGNVLTFAACNHCCKILTGSSKGGTTHLARHTCPCKFKPVEAGRKDKGSGGDVNRQQKGGVARPVNTTSSLNTYS